MDKICYKPGDKVFAKVKGYPPWPAKIEKSDAGKKKYNVLFYGTNETGVIKMEDLFYYLKYKKAYVPKYVKRAGYEEAVEAIENDIKEDGGDGNIDTNDESIPDNISDASSISSIPERKGMKRKASSLSADEGSSKKSYSRRRSVATSDSKDESEESTSKKLPVKHEKVAKSNAGTNSPVAEILEKSEAAAKEESSTDVQTKQIKEIKNDKILEDVKIIPENTVENVPEDNEQLFEDTTEQISDKINTDKIPENNESNSNKNDADKIPENTETSPENNETIPEDNTIIISEDNEKISKDDDKKIADNKENSDVTEIEPQKSELAKKNPNIAISEENKSGNASKTDSVVEAKKADGIDTVEEEESDDTLKLDAGQNIEIISEKTLNNFIAYAEYVKKNVDMYKNKLVEPRQDTKDDVLVTKLPSGKLCGIKLHKEFPITIQENEYDRAIYDEKVAKLALEIKSALGKGEKTIKDVVDATIIGNIGMTLEDVNEILTSKDIQAKRARLERLKQESDLVNWDCRLRNALGLDKVDIDSALAIIKEYNKLDKNLDVLIFKKHPHIIDCIRRLGKYVGNTKYWSFNNKQLDEFNKKAEKIRTEAEKIFVKIKKIFNFNENAEKLFIDSFMETVAEFRGQCKDYNESEVLMLCCEPGTRQAYLDKLTEMSDLESSLIPNAGV